MVGVVFVDLCKAFDTVGHSELITKQYGIEGPELEWFQDYLFGRTQTVQFGSASSSAEFVTAGVPQGSMLGPLLFILFLNDLRECLQHCDVVKYADATVIFCSLKDLMICKGYTNGVTKTSYYLT